MNFIKTTTTFILLLLLCLACSDPFRTQFDDREDAVMYEANHKNPAPASVDSLKILDWNIRYGGGRIPFFYDGYGKRYSMTKNEVEDNLSAIAAKIREINPDIVLLQEVDVDSKRSAYVDELQFILDYTQLNYGVYASIWKADFVPSDGLGRMNMGNAILSRWPLTDAVRIDLPIRTDQSSLEKYFWFHRNVLKAKTEPEPGLDFYIVNTHSEAFGKDGTKKKHIDRFKEELDLIHAMGEIFIAGGDLNEIPPGSPRWKDYPDDPPDARFEGDDYSGEETWLNALYNSYQSIIPLPQYQANPEKYFSFTADANSFWTRTLDYLFTNSQFKAGSGRVLQDEHLPDGHLGMPTMPLSDHAPLYVVVSQF